MDINKDFEEIEKYAHMWNWLPDWGIVRKIHQTIPDSYSVLTPFAYAYMEEMIRTTTSEYGCPEFDESEKPRKRKVGFALIKLAIDENRRDNADYVDLLEKTIAYYSSSGPFDRGDNRNSVAHGYMHARFWNEDSFEKLIHHIALLSKYSKF